MLKTLSVHRMQMKDRHVNCRVCVCFVPLFFSLLAILDYVGQQTLHKGTWLIFSH